MSLHNSFGKGSAVTSQRSVLKRHEKLQNLQEKGIWDESKGVLGLPKVKILKLKAKKEAPKEEEGAEKAAAPEGAAPPAAEEKKAKA